MKPSTAGPDSGTFWPATATAPSLAQVHMHSRLRVWWLTHVQGYHVIEVRRTPVRRMLGRIGYTSAWLLERR